MDESIRVDGRAAFSQIYLLGIPVGLLLVSAAPLWAAEGDAWQAAKALGYGIGLLAAACWARRVWRKMP